MSFLRPQTSSSSSLSSDITKLSDLLRSKNVTIESILDIYLPPPPTHDHQPQHLNQPRQTHFLLERRSVYDKDGYTLLHRAVVRQDIDSLRKLVIEFKISPNLTTCPQSCPEGALTLLFLACRHKCTLVIAFLLQQPQLEINTLHITAHPPLLQPDVIRLHTTIFASNTANSNLLSPHVVGLDTQNSDFSFSTPLLEAITNGDCNTVSKLIAAGAFVNYDDRFDYPRASTLAESDTRRRVVHHDSTYHHITTAVQKTKRVYQLHQPLFRAILMDFEHDMDRKLEIISHLLDAQANLNSLHFHHTTVLTPFLLSIVTNQFQLAQLFLTCHPKPILTFSAHFSRLPHLPFNIDHVLLHFFNIPLLPDSTSFPEDQTAIRLNDGVNNPIPQSSGFDPSGNNAAEQSDPSAFDYLHATTPFSHHKFTTSSSPTLQHQWSLFNPKSTQSPTPSRKLTKSDLHTFLLMLLRIPTPLALILASNHLAVIEASFKAITSQFGAEFLKRELQIPCLLRSLPFHLPNCHHSTAASRVDTPLFLHNDYLHKFAHPFSPNSSRNNKKLSIFGHFSHHMPFDFCAQNNAFTDLSATSPPSYLSPLLSPSTLRFDMNHDAYTKIRDIITKGERWLRGWRTDRTQRPDNLGSNTSSPISPQHTDNTTTIEFNEGGRYLPKTNLTTLGLFKNQHSTSVSFYNAKTHHKQLRAQGTQMNEVDFKSLPRSGTRINLSSFVNFPFTRHRTCHAKQASESQDAPLIQQDTPTPSKPSSSLIHIVPYTPLMLVIEQCTFLEQQVYQTEEELLDLDTLVQIMSLDPSLIEGLLRENGLGDILDEELAASNSVKPTSELPTRHKPARKKGPLKGGSTKGVQKGKVETTKNISNNPTSTPQPQLQAQNPRNNALSFGFDFNPFLLPPPPQDHLVEAFPQPSSTPTPAQLQPQEQPFLFDIDSDLPPPPSSNDDFPPNPSSGLTFQNQLQKPQHQLKDLDSFELMDHSPPPPAGRPTPRSPLPPPPPPPSFLSKQPKQSKKTNQTDPTNATPLQSHLDQQELSESSQKDAMTRIFERLVKVMGLGEGKKQQALAHVPPCIQLLNLLLDLYHCDPMYSPFLFGVGDAGEHRDDLAHSEQHASSQITLDHTTPVPTPSLESRIPAPTQHITFAHPEIPEIALFVSFAIFNPFALAILSQSKTVLKKLLFTSPSSPNLVSQSSFHNPHTRNIRPHHPFSPSHLTLGCTPTGLSLLNTTFHANNISNRRKVVQFLTKRLAQLFEDHLLLPPNTNQPPPLPTNTTALYEAYFSSLSLTDILIALIFANPSKGITNAMLAAHQNDPYLLRYFHSLHDVIATVLDTAQSIVNFRAEGVGKDSTLNPPLHRQIISKKASKVNIANLTKGRCDRDRATTTTQSQVSAPGIDQDMVDKYSPEGVDRIKQNLDLINKCDLFRPHLFNDYLDHKNRDIYFYSIRANSTAVLDYLFEVSREETATLEDFQRFKAHQHAVVDPHIDQFISTIGLRDHALDPGHFTTTPPTLGPSPSPSLLQTPSQLQPHPHPRYNQVEHYRLENSDDVIDLNYLDEDISGFLEMLTQSFPSTSTKPSSVAVYENYLTLESPQILTTLFTSTLAFSHVKFIKHPWEDVKKVKVLKYLFFYGLQSPVVLQAMRPIFYKHGFTLLGLSLSPTQSSQLHTSSSSSSSSSLLSITDKKHAENVWNSAFVTPTPSCNSNTYPFYPVDKCSDANAATLRGRTHQDCQNYNNCNDRCGRCFHQHFTPLSKLNLSRSPPPPHQITDIPQHEPLSPSYSNWISIYPAQNEFFFSPLIYLLKYHQPTPHFSHPPPLPHPQLHKRSYDDSNLEMSLCIILGWIIDEIHGHFISVDESTAKSTQ